MENIKVGFVGCGMMGSALIKAIAKAIPEKNIFVCVGGFVAKFIVGGGDG